MNFLAPWEQLLVRVKALGMFVCLQEDFTHGAVIIPTFFRPESHPQTGCARGIAGFKKLLKLVLKLVCALKKCFGVNAFKRKKFICKDSVHLKETLKRQDIIME